MTYSSDICGFKKAALKSAEATLTSLAGHMMRLSCDALILLRAEFGSPLEYQLQP